MGDTVKQLIKADKVGSMLQTQVHCHWRKQTQSPGQCGALLQGGGNDQCFARWPYHLLKCGVLCCRYLQNFLFLATHNYQQNIPQIISDLLRYMVAC